MILDLFYILIVIYVFTQLILPSLFPGSFRYNWIFKKRKVEKIEKNIEEVNNDIKEAVEEVQEKEEQIKQDKQKLENLKKQSDGH